jgi:Ca2+-transporting ATPase
MMVQGWTQDLMGRAHAMACEAVVEALDVSLEGGLSRSEVERRRGIWGKNEMPQLRARSAWRIFLAQFKSIMIALLGGAIIVALLYDDRVEAGAILVVLIVNASIGFITERQAERALDALRRAT